MDLGDARWSALLGGHGGPYDPRPALGRLADGDVDAAWEELWEELHHQGDVGEASYASIPELVRIHEASGRPDWNTYALAGTIEIARRSGANPPLPAWLADDYDLAWRRLQAMALTAFTAATDDDLVSSAFAVLAIQKDKIALGRLALMTEEERAELLEQAGWG